MACDIITDHDQFKEHFQSYLDALADVGGSVIRSAKWCRVHRSAMRTSVNVPEDVLTEFDRVWQSEGMESRSRAVREAMQEYVERHATLEAVEGEVVAMVAFDYEHTLVIGDLHSVQHEFQDVIETTSHSHQGEWCLESVFCRGDAARIRELAYRLRDFDAVGRANVVFLEVHDR